MHENPGITNRRLEMPFARLTLTSIPTLDQANHLATELTGLIAHDLGKRQELTSILVETSGIFHWAIGAEGRLTAAHLEVCVTAGTNSEQEKRAFIANAMTILRTVLPGLNPATYVVIRELLATDWGYDGRTQADRSKERIQGTA